MATRATWEPDGRFWRHRPVAITGATGFLGSHLTATLRDLGAHVVVLMRDQVPPTSIIESWWHQVAVVSGDVSDQRLLERLLGEYEVRTVFHLAAQTQVGVSNRNAISSFETNVGGTWSLCEAVRRSPRVEQMVAASSDKAYGSQPHLPYTEDLPLLAVHPYDVSKACADMIAASYHATYGVPVCITRCGNFFGPGDCNWERLVPGTIRSLLAGERPVIRSTGTLVRDYLYVVDGAFACLQLAEAMAHDPTVIGEAFNFSAENPLTVLDVVALVQEVLGTNLEPDVRATATHEIERQFLSSLKARKLLGWQPGWDFRDAMEETVRWYRAVLSRG